MSEVIESKEESILEDQENGNGGDKDNIEELKEPKPANVEKQNDTQLNVTVNQSDNETLSNQSSNSSLTKSNGTALNPSNEPLLNQSNEPALNQSNGGVDQSNEPSLNESNRSTLNQSNGPALSHSNRSALNQSNGALDQSNGPRDNRTPTKSRKNREKAKELDPKTLTYLEVVFMSTYNSCLKDQNHFMPAIITQLENGVRSFEFNFWCNQFDFIKDFILGQNEPGDCVNNTRPKNPESLNLSPWLSVINNWSNLNPFHVPLTLFLDTKHDIGRNDPMRGSVTNLTDICVKIFGNKIFTPNHMIQGKWPTIQQMLGKVVLVLTGNPQTCKFYLHDKGYNPYLAICNDNVIQVHNTKTGHLFYWTGILKETGTINWRWHSEYDRGETPSIAVREDGVVVEVHKSERYSGLWYTVGKISVLGYIVWNKPDNNSNRKFASGLSPKVIFLQSGDVKVNYWNGNTCYVQTGKVEPVSGIIKWEGAKQEQSNDIVQGPVTTVISQDGTTITTITQDTEYSESTLFYKTDKMDKPEKVRYNQVFFVDKTPSSQLPKTDEIFFYSCSSDDVESSKQANEEGKVTRVWEFGEFTQPTSLINFPATLFMDSWYSEFLEGKTLCL